MSKRILLFLSVVFYKFAKNFINIINRPYAFYRQLVNGDIVDLVFIFSLVFGYFFFISPIKAHSLHPFLITIKASKLFITALMSYLLICLMFWILGKLLSSQVKIKSIMLAWGYSLLPTLIWFFVTSFFYVFLPPPRHATFLGKVFSTVFVAFSIALLFWKGLLYYLTLRFALRLNLYKILGVSLVVVPILLAYSVWLYSLGIFKVPFI